jgi:hypothetical protein
MGAERVTAGDNGKTVQFPVYQSSLLIHGRSTNFYCQPNGMPDDPAWTKWHELVDLAPERYALSVGRYTALA